MGWTFYTTAHVQSRDDEKREIAALCIFDSDDRTAKPIQLSKVGSTWYAAVDVTFRLGAEHKTHGYIAPEEGTYVFAAVILVRYDAGCFGYKELDETMGPVESKAPASLLKRQSEIADPDSYAHAWRQRCRDHANRPRWKIGDRIRLADDVQLQDGSTVREVEKTTCRTGQKTRTCWQDLHSSTKCRLSPDCLVGAKRIGPAPPDGATSVLKEFFARQANAAGPTDGFR